MRGSPPSAAFQIIGIAVLCSTGIHALSVSSCVAGGTMNLDAAMSVIEKRNREREMERARQARRRAIKKLGEVPWRIDRVIDLRHADAARR